MGSIYFKFWPSEFWYRSFKQDVSLSETSGYEQLVLRNLAFVQVFFVVAELAHVPLLAFVNLYSLRMTGISTEWSR